MEEYWKAPLMKEIDFLKEKIRESPHSQAVYVQHSFVRGYIYGLHTAGIINADCWLALEKELNNMVFE